MSIKFETFFISISFENVNIENSDQLIHTGPLEVEEGGKVTISAQSLDAGMLRRKLRETGLRNPEVRGREGDVEEGGRDFYSREQWTYGPT